MSDSSSGENIPFRLNMQYAHKFYIIFFNRIGKNEQFLLNFFLKKMYIYSDAMSTKSGLAEKSQKSSVIDHDEF